MERTLGQTMEKIKKDLSALKIEREEERERAGSRALRTVALGTLLVTLIAGLIIAYRLWWAPLTLPEVEVARAVVESGRLGDEILTATGYVVAHRKAAVSPKISGRLEYLGVDIGHRVKADQIVARLEHRDLDAQLEDARAALGNWQATLNQAKARLAEFQAALQQAEATRHQARLDLQRQTKLLADGITPRADFDNAEARARVAEAQVKAAEAQIRSAEAQIISTQAQIRSAEARIQVIEAQIEYTNIRAPFDGLVISKDAELGETVAPAIFGGSSTRGSVVTIIDPKSLEVEVDVNESSIGRIHAGLPAEIALDAVSDRRFPGEAYQIVPTADRQKATVKVKVRFIELDPRILPDMSAKATFLKKTEGASNEPSSRVIVPKTAIQRRDGQTVVLVLSNDQIHIQQVQTGAESGDRVEIKQGLVGGEMVVVRGGDGLSAGSRVRVKTGK